MVDNKHKRVFGNKDKNGEYSKLKELEHCYFKSQVEFKLKQAKGTWTQAEKTLLPPLTNRLEKREEPIKKEVKMHQDKIKQLEVEVSKQFQIKKILQTEFEGIKEQYEIQKEKLSVLATTYETLRHSFHTMK